jgi:DNA-binding NarL/FixJ family response regulator
MEPAADRGHYTRLTLRQCEVLLLHCRGRTTEAVARQLFLQERTVMNRITRILT